MADKIAQKGEWMLRTDFGGRLTRLRRAFLATAALASSLNAMPALAQDTQAPTPDSTPAPSPAPTPTQTDPAITPEGRRPHRRRRACSGTRTFTPADFARFAPRTALDMLQRVPGFSIQQAVQERGLGQATGNVLLNGQRISNKSDDVVTQLSRVPAGNVVRIEIADAPRSAFRACPDRSPTSSCAPTRSAASSATAPNSAPISPIRS
jgi:outer membrane cobalamin receptor